MYEWLFVLAFYLVLFYWSPTIAMIIALGHAASYIMPTWLSIILVIVLVIAVGPSLMIEQFTTIMKGLGQ